jgi:hypothetical protein
MELSISRFFVESPFGYAIGFAKNVSESLVNSLCTCDSIYSLAIPTEAEPISYGKDILSAR